MKNKLKAFLGLMILTHIPFSCDIICMDSCDCESSGPSGEYEYFIKEMGYSLLSVSTEDSPCDRKIFKEVVGNNFIINDSSGLLIYTLVTNFSSIEVASLFQNPFLFNSFACDPPLQTFKMQDQLVDYEIFASSAISFDSVRYSEEDISDFFDPYQMEGVPEYGGYLVDEKSTSLSSLEYLESEYELRKAVGFILKQKPDTVFNGSLTLKLYFDQNKEFEYTTNLLRLQ